jgi:hypothetical protein
LLGESRDRKRQGESERKGEFHFELLFLSASQPKNSVREPGEPPPATAAEPPGEVLTLAEAEPSPE